MTKIEELEEREFQVLDDIASIKGQLEFAKSLEGTPDAFNPTWAPKARHALRKFQIEHQRIVRQLSRMKRQERMQERHIDAYFVDVAKRELDEDDFQEMWQMAVRRKEAASIQEETHGED